MPGLLHRMRPLPPPPPQPAHPHIPPPPTPPRLAAQLPPGLCQPWRLPDHRHEQPGVALGHGVWHSKLRRRRVRRGTCTGAPALPIDAPTSRRTPRLPTPSNSLQRCAASIASLRSLPGDVSSLPPPLVMSLPSRPAPLSAPCSNSVQQCADGESYPGLFEVPVWVLNALGGEYHMK